MRLPGTPHQRGPLLELGWLRRQLSLGHPVDEGTAPIPVAQIVGTIERGHDFDADWRPLNRALARRIAELALLAPGGLDRPIDVVRVDRAYFVLDGHKRVAIAKRTGREFIDAHVQRVRSDYVVDPGLDEAAVFRTAREAEFRRHAGLTDALPEVRFALTDIDTYGELFASVQWHALELSEKAGRIVPRDEVGRDWYASVYAPAVAKARENVGDLVDGMTDADLFLFVHRQRLAWWGSECDDPDCAAHEYLAKQLLAKGRRLGRRSERPAGGDASAALLPLSTFERS